MSGVLTRLWRARRMALVYGVLLGIGWIIGLALQDAAFTELRPATDPMIGQFLVLAVLAYVVTAAIPFVPGAEIGIALLLMFGARAAPIVYFGMVGALCLSFAVARHVPREPLCRGLDRLGLTRAARLVAELEQAAEEDREELILSRLSAGVLRRVVTNRYLLLAIAINLPGNSLLGGGGGLAFAAGLSGLFGFWAFVGTVALAVAPIPLAFLVLA